MTALAEFKAMREEYEKKIADGGKAALAGEFTAFFAAHPEVKALGWTQYTPHFNDGDPCEFGVNEFNYTQADVDAERVDSIHEEPWHDLYDRSNRVAAEAVRTLARALPEDVMEAAFGDHVQVIATPAGFHVTEYEHD